MSPSMTCVRAMGTPYCTCTTHVICRPPRSTHPSCSVTCLEYSDYPYRKLLHFVPLRGDLCQYLQFTGYSRLLNNRHSSLTTSTAPFSYSSAIRLTTHVHSSCPHLLVSYFKNEFKLVKRCEGKLFSPRERALEHCTMHCLHCSLYTLSGMSP